MQRFQTFFQVFIQNLKLFADFVIDAWQKFVISYRKNRGKDDVLFTFQYASNFVSFSFDRDYVLLAEIYSGV
jgi:hypothetical protein